MFPNNLSHEACLHSYSIIISFCAVPHVCCPPHPDSSYWSHAGLHSTGREESSFAAQLPPRFPQVRFNSHHTTRDFMACMADSQMSCYIHMRISAARLVANRQNMKSIFCSGKYFCWDWLCILWQIDLMFGYFGWFMCGVWFFLINYVKSKSK